VEPLDRPAVDAGVLLVPLGLVVGLVVVAAGQDAGSRDARHGEDEHDHERQNASFHGPSFSEEPSVG
jgi:hypothetical protein